MPFMVPQIVLDDWYCVETSNGTEVVPLDVCLDAENATDLRDYLEGEVDENSEMEMTRKYGARLSAPGYLDCTDWSLCDSEDEARRYLEEVYEVCSYCGVPIPICDDGYEPKRCECGKKYLT